MIEKDFTEEAVEGEPTGLGRFVAFEGPDCAGKTTLIRLVKELLPGSVAMTRQPGGSATGGAIRKILKSANMQDELPLFGRRLLFSVAEMAFQRSVIGPLLRMNDWVLCDRFTPISNYCYGFAEGLDSDQIMSAEAMVDRVFVPQLVVLVRAPDQVLVSRLAKKDRRLDPAEKDPELFSKVNQMYRELYNGAAARGIVDTMTLSVSAVVVESTMVLPSFRNSALEHLRDLI